jgi:putative ABC transport system substrate-binding protein
MLLFRHTKRRAFIAGLGSAAAWSLAARAQQPTMPVVSYLQFGATRVDLTEGRNKALLIGLSQAGFDNGRNVIVDPIPVLNLDQLPTAVAAQVQRKVAVICGTLEIAVAAKAATSTSPIVFATVDDPVNAGVVSSYSRPGGNVTGFGCAQVTNQPSCSNYCTNSCREQRPLACLSIAAASGRRRIWLQSRRRPN